MHPPPKNGPAPIDAALDAVLREVGIRASPTEERVLNAYREVAGEQLLRVTDPTRFQKGDMHVIVHSAAQLQELQNFTGESLRKRINEHLGSELVRRMSFKPHAG